jgi:hypothetical protein
LGGARLVNRGASDGSGAVAVDVAVEGGVARKDRADEAGQGAGGFLGRHADPGSGFGKCQVHFVGVLDGLEDLRLKSFYVSIPEEGLPVAAINERRRIATSLPSENA